MINLTDEMVEAAGESLYAGAWKGRMPGSIMEHKVRCALRAALQVAPTDQLVTSIVDSDGNTWYKDENVDSDWYETWHGRASAGGDLRVIVCKAPSVSEHFLAEFEREGVVR